MYNEYNEKYYGRKEHTGGMGSVIAALGANVLVAISKFVGYALSGSAAMLNESIHSLVDCGNPSFTAFWRQALKRHKPSTSFWRSACKVLF